MVSLNISCFLKFCVLSLFTNSFRNFIIETSIKGVGYNMVIIPIIFSQRNEHSAIV